jgi:hypothetical protein
MDAARRAAWRIPLAVIAGLSAAAFVAGFAYATLTVTAGAAEHVGGDQAIGNYLGAWSEVSALRSSVPAPAPGAVSTTVGSPTPLASANTSFVLNPATANDTALQWNFSELTSAPPGAEIEITFTITTGVTPTTATFTVYVQTQATAPSYDLVFWFYWDSGGTGALAVDSDQTVSQQCAGVGNCP